MRGPLQTNRRVRTFIPPHAVPTFPRHPHAMSRSRRLLWYAVPALALGLAAVLWMSRPRFSTERVRDAVVTTIQAEAPASDLVTGRVSLSARREIHDLGRFSWLPSWLDLPGVNFLDAEARVSVSGDALYGFDVRQLAAEMIEVHPDGLVEVTLPPLRVVAVEVDLAEMRMASREGVFRSGAGRQLEREALADLQDVLREQAERHLETSVQPGIHTARALQAMLTPPLRAAGLEQPRFRFRVAPDLVLSPPPE